MIERRVPEHLMATELIQEARQEIAQFLHDHQATDDACAFELFRRAIVLRDEQAWAGLYELYNAVVSSWILRLVPKLANEDLDALVNGTFAKFACALPAEKGKDDITWSMLLTSVVDFSTGEGLHYNHQKAVL